MDVATKNIFTHVEKGFNFAGCIPVASIFSGVLRVTAAKIQAIVGIVLLATAALNFLLNPSEKWVNMALLGSEFIFHGALNILRGLGEVLLGCTGFGSLLLLIPNVCKDDMFSPFFAYDTVSNLGFGQRFAYHLR